MNPIASTSGPSSSHGGHGPDVLRGQRHGEDLRRLREGRGSGEGTEGRSGAIHRGAHRYVEWEVSRSQ